ncbi:MAG: DUF5916 domain-containing protein [Bacteroidota bacterium]
MKNYYLCFSLLLFSISLFSQEKIEIPQKSYEAHAIPKGQKIEIDAYLNEGAWDKVRWGGGDFTVNQPNNGEQPQRQTKFKIIYDDNYLYVGYLCLDESPDEVVRFMSRRDNFPGDWVEINIDSYADKNTAFSFTISASGVKGDEFISNNGNNWDDSWNPIWYAKSRLHKEGWMAEIKIPLSQIRFSKEDKQLWGFNITRRDFRADERSTFQHVPINASGWVSNFAELRGIKGVKPKRKVELQPYVVGGIRDNEASASESTETIGSIGLDGKLGVTPNLTLDFTVNPDFGQVEADPSALNIDGFQVFFREQRPFFIENANLFDFAVSRIEAGGPHDNDNLFYSRRIGQSPSGSLIASDTSIVDYPTSTSILGAAKFSGKTRNGLSVGILESVTQAEFARVTDGENTSLQEVEPYANWFVGRLSQDLGNGASQIGATFTSTKRFLEGTPLLDQFHDEALSGGVNLLHTWKDRQWQFKANLVGSRISGSAKKILDTQRSFEHYFQRPDAKHLSIDSTATSLSGHGGRLTIANYGGQDNISFETGVTWRSPKLELNDLGFMNTADQIHHFLWAGYRFPKPFSIFRRLRINYNHYSAWDFGGRNLYRSINMNTHAGFTNFWSLSTGATWEFRDISTKALFGGPTFRNPVGIFNWINLGSDQRKKFVVYANFGRFYGLGQDKEALSNYNVSLNINYQPSNRLSFRFGPRFRKQNRVIQNIGRFNFEGEDRYVTGRIIQETLSMSIRASYNFTPNLTLEYWGQPFISKGNYSEFKYITDPLASRFQDRFALYSPEQMSINNNGDVTIDEDMDGFSDYSFGNPDFNLIQWRSNMVLRFEYIPGSELFLVWSQSSSSFGDPSDQLLNSLEDNLFSNALRNVFLLKLTYRFVR